MHVLFLLRAGTKSVWGSLGMSEADCFGGFQTATFERTAAKHRLSKAQHAA